MSDGSTPRNYRDRFDAILREAVELGASDIHLKVGLPPIVRHSGALRPIGKDLARLTPEDTYEIARSILGHRNWQRFEELEEIDMGYGVQGAGRFRINVFKQRGTVGLVARTIPYEVSTIDDLILPQVLKKLCAEQRGLILVTGATGSGKSTTLAAMIQEINATRTTHIITVEDPIEFLIKDRKSIITQREVSLDTKNFATALRNALRQDPDVILVGEMRDRETIHTVLTAAETGHLVFSTLHTNDATESINRIISVFEAHQQEQIRIQLSSVLRAVVSQRLVVRKDGTGLVAACEVMVVNARVRDMILDAKRTNQLIHAIEEGGHAGMISFDQSLMQLVKQGVISYQDAVEASTNPTDFELRYKGVASMDGNKWNHFDGGIDVNKKSTVPKSEDLRDTHIEVETAQWPGKKRRVK